MEDMSQTTKSSPEQMLATGQRLRQAMDRQGLNVFQLSQASHISTATIYHFLNGQREMHLDDIQLLSSALQVKPSWLAWGD
ncbi:hypothetical protein PBI_MOSMORIS_22 [Mycobacterium phage MosMoris]|uniref:HTH cro/C1-type domain-containing protein n=2 Tax=Marvinvirus mosmoris TaxID=1982093 RepID=A0A023ZWA3_9CAUD|nr:hypothetical protein FH33_gp022 [Mycobacterium phage MosMoris]AHY84096.1 hypothetical protein PBI_MOSMORIS_22 [Mycobacterium phage MosMoris]ANM46246.1 helix-turn-helix DNA binding protein [Mycobacterium phage Gattaca]